MQEPPPLYWICTRDKLKAAVTLKLCRNCCSENASLFSCHLIAALRQMYKSALILFKVSAASTARPMKVYFFPFKVLYNPQAKDHVVFKHLVLYEFLWIHSDDVQYFCEVGKGHFPFLQLENQNTGKKNYFTENCSENSVGPEEMFPAYTKSGRVLVGMWLWGISIAINQQTSLPSSSCGNY